MKQLYNKPIKKPASHITSIIILSVLFLLGLARILSPTFEVRYFFTSLIFPAIFLIGVIGVVMVKKWSRIYCSIIYLLFIIVYPLVTLKRGIEKEYFVPAIILVIMVIALLIWLLYSFAFGKKSVAYFKEKNENRT